MSTLNRVSNQITQLCDQPYFTALKEGKTKYSYDKDVRKIKTEANLSKINTIVEKYLREIQNEANSRMSFKDKVKRFFGFNYTNHLKNVVYEQTTVIGNIIANLECAKESKDTYYENSEYGRLPRIYSKELGEIGQSESLIKGLESLLIDNTKNSKKAIVREITNTNLIVQRNLKKAQNNPELRANLTEAGKQSETEIKKLHAKVYGQPHTAQEVEKSTD